MKKGMIVYKNGVVSRRKNSRTTIIKDDKGFNFHFEKFMPEFDENTSFINSGNHARHKKLKLGELYLTKQSFLELYSMMSEIVADMSSKEILDNLDEAYSIKKEN